MLVRVDLSAFDIIGPSMVGPSSSHTAGAVRLGLLGRRLLGAPPARARIGLHGSFAATGAGHATDRGLAAGLLGWAPDDDRLRDALDVAAREGLDLAFAAEDLGESVHPNTARLRLESVAGAKVGFTGASLGGGMVAVTEVDGFATRLTGELDTLVIWHADQPGFLAKVTGLLACVEANIASIQTSRRTRGDEALTRIETDAPLPREAVALLAGIRGVTRLAEVAPLAP
jgi:L-serine dehydratase